MSRPIRIGMQKPRYTKNYGAFIHTGNGGFYTPVLGDSYGFDTELFKESAAKLKEGANYLYRNYTPAGMLQTKVESAAKLATLKAEHAREELTSGLQTAMIGAAVIGALAAGGMFYLAYLSITKPERFE